MTPDPTTASPSYSTATCPLATPYAGSSSSSAKPPGAGVTDAGSAGER